MTMRRCFSFLLLLALTQQATPSWRAQDPKPSDPAVQSHAPKYPLRLHILAIDNTHRTVRMQPNWSSGSFPDASGEMTSPSSGGGTATLGGGKDDFSGAGRADLVTPPNGTVGLNYTYEGCPRVRVTPGFFGLEARWTKPGSRLEVLIPTEAVSDGAPQTVRCTLKLVTQEFVYLRMPSGAIVRVSQEAYSRKPSLRAFLSGGSETLKRRGTRLPEAP